MKLTTVLSCVNDNPEYYKFIPYQIAAWNCFQIHFVAVFVGDKLPEELIPYKDNIILWNYTPEFPSSFVAQNLRLYIPALFKDFPEDELILITDMDMLPTKPYAYVDSLDIYKKEDFLTYNLVPWHAKQVYICYNAAHPETWSKIFDINSNEDVINSLNKTYFNTEGYNPGDCGWFIDQVRLYSKIENYPNWVRLNRVFERIGEDNFKEFLSSDNNFINNYDDIHFFRHFLHHKDVADKVLQSIKSIYPYNVVTPLRMPVLK